jgi:hypothetical protein
MLRLTTIQPNWLRIINLDRIRRRVGIRSLDGHEPRKYARHVAGLGDGHAGLGEGGLRDGVVVGCELELHHVACGGFYVVGCEC